MRNHNDFSAQIRRRIQDRYNIDVTNLPNGFASETDIENVIYNAARACDALERTIHQIVDIAANQAVSFTVWPDGRPGSRFDGMFGKQIREQAERERNERSTNARGLTT